MAAVLGGVVIAGTGTRGAGAEGEAGSYEAVAAADGVRFSVSAPGFAVVETFIDGGGPASQSIIDGLGNSKAFASLPYPGDLAISGPGLLAGFTGLPSPPPYPFYVYSSYPTNEEAKFTQPGYELLAKSAEQTSEATASTGGGSGESGIGLTKTRAFTNRDPATGTVVAEASGTSDFVNVGGVLRIGHVTAIAKVSRAPGAEPTRESSFAIDGATVAGQAVGISEKGLTVAGQTTPLPADNPLFQALAQAKITVSALAASPDADGVVSPGLVVDQQQQVPGGPTMVFRYIFGQMSAHATASGSPTSVGSELLVDTGTAGGSFDSGGTAGGPTEAASPSPSLESAPAGDLSSVTGGPAFEAPTGGASGAAEGGGATAEEGAAAAAPSMEGTAAAPITASGPSAESVYLIVALGAIVALAGGLLIRLVGVKLAWTS